MVYNTVSHPLRHSRYRVNILAIIPQHTTLSRQPCRSPFAHLNKALSLKRTHIIPMLLANHLQPRIINIHKYLPATPIVKWALPRRSWPKRITRSSWGLLTWRVMSGKVRNSHKMKVIEHHSQWWHQLLWSTRNRPAILLQKRALGGRQGRKLKTFLSLRRSRSNTNPWKYRRLGRRNKYKKCRH